MQGKRPDYVVATVEELGNGQRDRWTDVGVAFHNGKSDTYTVNLSALPLNGKLVLYRPKRLKDEQPPVIEEQ